MPNIDPETCRQTAERCRARANLSINPKEWICFSEEWLRLAEIAEHLSRGHPVAASLQVGLPRPI